MTWETLKTTFLPPLLCGLAAHLVYRRLEPRELFLHFILLVLVPLTLTPFFTDYIPSVRLAALLAWVCYVTSLVACTVIYRLSPVHPLAKYPGPLLCKITRLYFTSVALSGKQYKYYNELHRHYGDIVRIGPNELSFCSPDLVAPVLGPHGMPKSAFWSEQSTDPNYTMMVGIRNPQKHADIRRVWARGFTAEALRGYHPVINKRLGQLVDHLRIRAGQAVDLSKWISWFAYDVVNDIAFGDDLDTMQNKDSQVQLAKLENVMSLGTLFSHLPWTAAFVKVIPTVEKTARVFQSVCYKRLKRRIEEGSESGTRDLISHLMSNGRLDSTIFDFKQIVNDAPLMVVAGSDTVSLTLCTLFYFLLCNPVAYSRLQAEIDNSKLAWDDSLGLAQLEYLNAVINETLRIVPPVLSGSSRSPLIGSGGIRLGPHFLPEGTTATIHTYTVHRDPRNFFLPEKFIPERWLSEEKQLSLEPGLFKNRDAVIHNLNAFIPFSYGPADCIGKRFAWLELRAVVVAILQNFTLEFDIGYDKATWERDMGDYFITKRPPLYAVLKPRLPSL